MIRLPRPLGISLVLPLLAIACAPTGPAAGLAVSAPVSATAQQATPTATPSAGAPTAAASTGPACLATPDYSRQPVAGRNGSTTEWVARANGNGCQWVRKRA